MLQNNSRLMVRLIDVALIILLGFIAISRLKTEYVDLPASTNTEPQQGGAREAVVHIYEKYFEIRAGEQYKRFTEIPQLERAMVSANREYASRGEKIVFTIESHKSSVLQSLIDVLDICQRHNIEKSLNYDRYN